MMNLYYWSNIINLTKSRSWGGHHPLPLKVWPVWLCVCSQE